MRKKFCTTTIAIVICGLIYASFMTDVPVTWLALWYVSETPNLRNDSIPLLVMLLGNLAALGGVVMAAYLIGSVSGYICDWLNRLVRK